MIRFVLRPVVENSVIHGLAGKEGGTISISMWSEGGDGFIRIEDDGDGIEESKLKNLQYKIDKNEVEKGKEIGILNVNRRLKVCYGEYYGLFIQSSKGQGTSVILKFRISVKQE